MIPDFVRARLDVSRETLERLVILADLLKKWNSKINLVSPNTIDDLWTRHVLDSAQMFDLQRADGGKWLDIGSGGGFPGLVIAILNMESEKPWDVTMMESDMRKCTFLRTVLRETGAIGTVTTSRIEKALPHEAQVVSARALADLNLLCSFSERHVASGGCRFLQRALVGKKRCKPLRSRGLFPQR